MTTLATLAKLDAITEPVAHVYRHQGATAPALVSGSPRACAYWESRFELFIWACEALGLDPCEAVFIDAFTGEVLDYWALEEELLEELDAA